jgi:hypothetical protein
VIVTVGLTAAVPSSIRPESRWFLLIVGLLLLALFVAEPGRIGPPTRHDAVWVGFTSALAFSPTDAMPLAPWAKIAMGIESLVSLTILTLVIATAVNLLA